MMHEINGFDSRLIANACVAVSLDIARRGHRCPKTPVLLELSTGNDFHGGAIFTRTIHASPACVRTAEFVNLRIESEIALKLGSNLPASGAPWMPKDGSALRLLAQVRPRNFNHVENVT